MTTLCDLQTGECGIVLCNACESSNACRLAELGLTEGEEVRVLQAGCPMLVQIGDSRMSMRSDAAAQISVAQFAA